MGFVEFALGLMLMTAMWNMVGALKDVFNDAKDPSLSKSQPRKQIPSWVPTTSELRSGVPPPPTPQSVQVTLHEGKTPKQDYSPQHSKNIGDSLDVVHQMLHDRQGTTCDEDL